MIQCLGLPHNGLVGLRIVDVQMRQDFISADNAEAG